MMQTENRKTTSKKSLVSLVSALLIVAIVTTYGLWKKSNEPADGLTRIQQEPIKVESSAVVADKYDVIVAGTDPEGIAAAVSAARNGLKVLLVEGKDRDQLGGLMTKGGLNTIDLNYTPGNSARRGKPDLLNRGIFQQFYDQIEGSSFDVITAANVFAKMVKEERNIDLVMHARQLEPTTVKSDDGQATITGVKYITANGESRTILADAVIDATQDGDIAAASGAPYTVGREDIGDPDAQMAVTLVFKLSGVTDKIWNSFAGHKNTGTDDVSAWGFPEAREYVPSNPEKVRMRGLNIGRQNDGTILINAMHIFGIDPLNPASVEEGLKIGRAEAPRIADYLIKHIKEFKKLKYAGTADELYVRETRHIQGEYRLTLADVMENRDHWDAIAYGSYDVDIQSTDHTNSGYILMSPYQYGIPFRTLVPLKVDNLLIVGRAASFDSLPAGSARVIPVGMAAGEAAGAALKLAKDNQINVRDLSKSKELVAKLRSNLTNQGMDLSFHQFKEPYYLSHPDYKGLLTAASLLMTSGAENNKAFDLDGRSNAQRYVNQLSRLTKAYPHKFAGKPIDAITAMTEPAKNPLSLAQAVKTLAFAISESPDEADTVDKMLERGWIKQSTLDAIRNKDALTNGEAYMLMRDVLDLYAGIVYQ
ncbi:FAD-dependent oxidoreductase [Cohnella soli]|uniref:FAD-dependent oxidoreductase n=1 Tax=Cohnella soli TaxID=425005 RepID=A0ABW0HTK4_9BACL